MSIMKPKLVFPKDFLWGSATSAHQVEGNQNNNWTDWEKERAAALARGAKKAFDNPSVHWYRIKEAAVDPMNYISGRAVDHYRRYEEDFDYAKKLRHNAHRFSIEWSRIEPRRGGYDERQIEHYRKVIRALRRRGIEPLVTLHHFTLPHWVQAQGGFASARTVEDFARFAGKMASEYNEDVQWWCTVNEPELFASFSYYFGLWPPQSKNVFKASYAYYSVFVRAHKAAYKAIKHVNPHAMVGAAKNNSYYVVQDKVLSPLTYSFAQWWGNHAFFDRTHKYMDYLGLNYYFRFNIVKGRVIMDQQNPSDLGWGLHAEGLYEILKNLHGRYHLPVVVTEAGAADGQDEVRAWYIKELLRNIHRAMSEGVDVRGFMYWSLMDNFEWDKGFWPKFGLLEVDRKTMLRSVRPSAYEYAKVIRAGGLD
ncbi:glycoside hydrolase family 1 protein [bacterium]|nr:glycoside hydrolase family 1 protein [bacterium]